MAKRRLTMEKIDYKKIVNAAIGEKPSLVKPDVLEFNLNGEKAYLHKEDFFKKYPRTPEQAFVNPPRFTQE